MIKFNDFHNEEVANTITHGIGILFGITAFILLIHETIQKGDLWTTSSFIIYGLGMLSSFVTSTFYHACEDLQLKKTLRKLDHSAIYIFIAGTYTPFTLVTLREEQAWGWSLFAVVWTAAAIGIMLSFLKMKKTSHLKTLCYLAMGWVIIFAFNPLVRVLSSNGRIDILYWLIAGGICYTVGAVFYFFDKYKYMHPIWHLFVLGGGICHFVAIYNLL